MDRQWLDGLRRADAATFDAVYAHYRGRLYSFLYRLAGQRDLAEDLFQETWMKLAKNAVTLDAETDLGGWLFTVARNAYYSHRRWVVMDAGRRREIEPEDGSATPEREAESRRAVDELERALAQLPAKDREVLLLVGVEGMEPEQAAAVLGIKWEALRQRLSRARALLADWLGSACAEEGGQMSEMSDPSDHDELKRLRSLGLAELDELKAERVRRLAQLVFAEERRLLGRPWRRRAGRAWTGVVVPTLLAAACVVYLVWAVDFTAALYR